MGDQRFATAFQQSPMQEQEGGQIFLFPENCKSYDTIAKHKSFLFFCSILTGCVRQALATYHI
jgi:hypothetical protein